MKILFAGAEALPFIKVGGLGDVLGALPKTLAEKGADARVVLPLYAQIPEHLRSDMTLITQVNTNLSWRCLSFNLYACKWSGVTYYFIDNAQYFNRERVYGEYDDAERYAFFSKAVLDMLPHIDFFPDILHVNDWHTALTPVYLDACYRQTPGFERIRTVLSIHNIEFQGKFDPLILGDVFGLGTDYLDVLSYNGCLNLLKGAIERCDRVVTVSETYAHEIMTAYFSFGLRDILLARAYKVSGILNGIDTELFSPKNDRYLAANYDLSTVSRKLTDKKDLQERLGLPADEHTPVIGMVTRLTSQKGLDLIREVMPSILELGVQFSIIGTGEAAYEDFIRYYHLTAPNFKGLIAFSTEMASKLYAGADLFLMPSRSEPCGLAQMIAMAYGTIPIVHTVGGLKDTVIPYSPQTGSGNGVTFNSYNAYDMLDAIKRAVELYRSPEDFSQLITNAMSADFSWNKSADKYLDLYRDLSAVNTD